MLDTANRGLIQGQPGDRADRARHEQKPVGIAQVPVSQILRQCRRDCDPRKIVVSERRMADVTRDEHLICGIACQTQLTIGQMARFQNRVDANFVFVLLQRNQLVMSDAESPQWANNKRSYTARNPDDRDR